MDMNNCETANGRGGRDDQIGVADTVDNLSDEKFIAEFKRIRGPDPAAITLKLAALCAAKKSFSAEKSTLSKLKLTPSKFSKYAQIGRDRRFNAIRNQLPKKAGYSVLYAMTQLSDEQWRDGFENGIISPQSSRSEIDAFRTGVAREKASRSRSERYFAAVTIPPKTSAKDKDGFRAALISLCENVGFEAVFPEHTSKGHGVKESALK
jgi:hypothetical protein